MRGTFKFIGFFFILLGADFDVFAQNNTLGKEFYFGFMENHATPFLPATASVLITASEKTSGYIEYNNQKTFFDLEKGQQHIQDYENKLYNVLHSSSGLVEEKSIYVATTGLVAVHAFNKRQASADGTVILPVTALGKEYYITSHYDEFESGLDISPSNKNYESTLLLVAVADETEVEITATARVDLNGAPVPAVAPIRIKLDKGQTFQLKAATGDLTGTRVRVVNGQSEDCKNLAVFGGNKMTSAGDNCATSGDHLFQQAYPLPSWGKSYIHIPLADRTSGELIKVLASENNTEVKLNGISKGTLNRGAFFTFEFTKDDLVSIETSKPTAVSMIAKSGNCNDQNDSYSRYGDPSLVTLSPVNQLMKEMVFSSVKINWIRTHLVNILVKKGTAQQTFLNGQAVGSQFKPVPTNPNFEYARLVVEEGPNLLQNSSGFNAISYGSGAVESYVYAVGASLEPIQFETTTTYPFEVVGDKVACLGSEGSWAIQTETSTYKNFSWDFGDGSALQDGVEALHTFQKPGNYQISVRASTGDESCDSEETFRFEVFVEAVAGELKGPRGVCPGSDQFTYRLESDAALGQIGWEIEGGVLLQQEADQVTVQWDSGRTSGKIVATPYTLTGCPGQRRELAVTISEALTPEAPLGSSGICGGDLLLSYQVPYSLANRDYSWSVIGGTLISGQGEDQVQVLWDANAPIRELVYEESSVANGACKGISSVLTVDIFSPLVLESPQVFLPACVGEANGSIQIQPRGGSSKYTYQWAHDASLSTNFATGLPAGMYLVTVYDASGCDFIQMEVRLEEPAPLQIQGDVEVKEVSCFAGTDGQIRLNIVGGSPPYTVSGFDSQWESPNLTVFGFAAGKYQLRIQDSKGCVIPLEVDMIEPMEVVVVPEEIQPGCEGSFTGQVQLEISGGKAPFEVVWDNGSEGLLLTELAPGAYSYTVTDAKGCMVVGTTRVSQAEAKLRMPTGFLPSDGEFGPISNCPVTYELLIWNRWGDLVFRGAAPWDGKIKSVTAPIGSYSYFLRYSYTLEGKIQQEEKSGIFTLFH